MIVTFVTLPAMLLLLFSEYNKCHQIQLGNPSAIPFVPRSKVFVPLLFHAELTFSWANLYQSVMMVAMMVIQADPLQGNTIFLSSPWAPCEVEVQFYHLR